MNIVLKGRIIAYYLNNSMTLEIEANVLKGRIIAYYLNN